MTLAVPGDGTADFVAEVKRLLAPEARDGELRLFAMVCGRLDLDPFAGEISLVPRDGKHRPVITLDGRLVTADRTGELELIDGPVWAGPRASRSDPFDWLEVWDDDETPPYVARCLVYRTGRGPANGTAKWSEFAQHKNNGQLMPTWQAMPSHMLGKVALAMALRRRFPEVGRAVRMATSWPAIAGDLEADDAALLADAETGETEIPAAADPPGPRRSDRRRRETVIDVGAKDPRLNVIRQLLEGLDLDVGDVGLPPDGELDDLDDENRANLLERLKTMARGRAMRDRSS